MDGATRQIEQLQIWIDRMQAGDPTARNELLRHACERLRRLTRKMLKGFARVKRWELTDDVLQNYGPEGMGAHQASKLERDRSASPPLADLTLEPSRLAIWSEFHQRVETLPEEEREVFDLLWYQGLTQPEAAALLGISEATLRRRWLAARERLHQALKGDLPGS